MNEFAPPSGADSAELRAMMNMNAGPRGPEQMDPAVRAVLSRTRTEVAQDMEWPTMPQ